MGAFNSKSCTWGVFRLLISEFGKNTSIIDKLNPINMAGNSSTSSDLELFTREINWDTRPTISKTFVPSFFSGFGFSLALFYNLLQRRPVLSGIQKHIALAALGVPIGLYAERKVDERSARRDAALIQYIKLHPESFPETERVKYKDVLQPWIPLR